MTHQYFVYILTNDRRTTLYTGITAAITREKQIKAGSRQKKIDLITSVNPDWRDLYNDIV